MIVCILSYFVFYSLSGIQFFFYYYSINSLVCHKTRTTATKNFTIWDWQYEVVAVAVVSVMTCMHVTRTRPCAGSAVSLNVLSANWVAMKNLHWRWAGWVGRLCWHLMAVRCKIVLCGYLSLRTRKKKSSSINFLVISTNSHAIILSPRHWTVAHMMCHRSVVSSRWHFACIYRPLHSAYCFDHPVHSYSDRVGK